ncbi:MAG: helix-turn-helix domain-containing protein [Bacteroidetes bacterium]|nr:helix-turn-helix domain-containing protein [Bacteroidota bacterium]
MYIILPTKSIVDLTNYLPTTLEALGKISGVGKTKLKQFGEEIIEIIFNYCEKNNITTTSLTPPQKRERGVKKNDDKPDTKSLSFELYKSGKTIDEIAKERGFSTGTIEGHLAHYVGKGKLNVSSFISEDKVDSISVFFKTNPGATLPNAKAALGDSVSYADLRFVMKHLENLGEKN